jgi:hypothetical protein
MVHYRLNQDNCCLLSLFDDSLVPVLKVIPERALAFGGSTGPPQA